MSNLRTLMFHDVVFEDQFNSSGFPGNDSAIYKLTQKQFSKNQEKNPKKHQYNFFWESFPILWKIM